ncbi:MAG TPA: two-component regulator propeller domain-containing protein, partial [Chitinophagaceae bacterium]|nr:two-component regulator propeller domain-containing protein [Chitinophagaceae bacterium]
MILTRYILIVWLSAVLPATGFTQSSQYRLETFGTRDGLLSSKVYALAQSSDRMLWIGTELGVSVYDGYSFTNYQYTSGNESIGRILCLTQDKLNGMWLGGDKGLFYFKGDSIIKVELQNKTLLAVETLLTDATGNVWAGDLNALYKITATQVENLNKNNLTTLPLSPFASFNERVFSLATDNRQNIYWGSYDGVFKIPADKNTYEQIWTNPNPLLPVRSVAAISPD